MNPADALPQDRSLYYHGCWLKHRKKGIGQVHVDGDRMKMYFFPGDKLEPTPTTVDPGDLSCWWPRAGAYNTERGAVYVSRKAIRSMRKSANPNEHYIVKFGRPTYHGHELMLVMRNGPQTHDINTAITLLNKKATKAEAITRDIILTRGKFDETLVVFRGIIAGEYRDGEFVPSFNGSPIAKRVMYKLAREEMR